MFPPDQTTERFAPSPTGRLHLGHAFSALAAHDAARGAGGRFLLRMEDIDRQRSRPEFEEGIKADLRWLGIVWDGPVLRQSERGPAYAAALQNLVARGLIYPCECTRRDVLEALGAPQEGAPGGLDGPVYPGTCRGRPLEAAAASGRPHALRLDIEKAIDALGGVGAVSALAVEEVGRGPAGERGRLTLDPVTLVERVGDVTLMRKDWGASYHLAVVVDDAFQGVTHVTRGEDLFAAAFLHRLLQALLALPSPVWRHHRLIRDEAGRRLAKRDDARALATLRAEGATPEEVRRLVGLSPEPVR